MSNRTYSPGAGNSPFGNLPANPQSANYITDSGYSATGTNLLRKTIEEAIYSAVPQQYYALKLLFQKQFKDVLSDEFEYLEKTFGRTALAVTTTASAVSASAGAEVTQVIPFTSDAITRIQLNDIICYPDGTKAIVRSFSGNNVTVASNTSVGLPAIAATDIFSIGGPLMADGENTFYHYDRMQTVTRYNYVQMMLRASRWSRLELQKYTNLGTTDYLEKNKGETMEQLRTDLFVTLFNGTRGEFKMSSTIPAKTTGGIYPSMVAAGSMSGNPTTASLVSQFKTLAFKTNYKQEGGTRMIYGTPEMLHELSGAFKDPGLRYQPNDSISSMDLKQYEFGGMKFVPVPCQLFNEQACFPATWQRKLLILDQETIQPVKVKGIPAFENGSTLDKGANGTREDFKDWWVGANMGLQFNNPLGSFTLDVQ